MYVEPRHMKIPCKPMHGTRIIPTPGNITCTTRPYERQYPIPDTNHIELIVCENKFGKATRVWEHNIRVRFEGNSPYRTAGDACGHSLWDSKLCNAHPAIPQCACKLKPVSNFLCTCHKLESRETRTWTRTVSWMPWSFDSHLDSPADGLSVNFLDRTVKSFYSRGKNLGTVLQTTLPIPSHCSLYLWVLFLVSHSSALDGKW